MVRIVSDTSTLYSSQQALEAGFQVAPLSVTINGQSYLEFDEIIPEQFVDIINQGHLPTSSQPSVGQVAEIFEQYPEDEIIDIAMADGLSGTYNGAVAAAQTCDHQDKITVINSRTLCGPHRYLVEKAVKMAGEGKSKAEIVAHVEELMATSQSYLMPADVDYLRRGGRLSPLVSYVGGAMKLVPIMTLTEDCKQLTVATIRRSFPQAVKHVIKLIEECGNGENWRIYISHAAAPKVAGMARELLQEHFPKAIIETYGLSPAGITQGGPGCMAIQTIRV